jgi:hypothetical protein
MRKSVILSAILFGSLVYNSAQAQVSVHIGFNIPARRVYVPAPPPQPVMVYDNDEFDDSDDYYYLPEVEAYYSIPRHCYYYQDGGSWVSAAYLPGAYRNYDWRTARRFEVRGRRPYMRHDQYRSKWGGSFNRGDWNRRDNYYADRRNNNRNDWNRRDNNSRNDWNRRDNNNRNDWNKGNNRFERPNGFNKPNRDRSNQGGWGQPNRNDRNGDRGNRGGWGQPSQPNRNDNRGDRRPSNNDGGRDRNRGGGDNNSQFAQNRGNQGGSHRPGRF